MVTALLATHLADKQALAALGVIHGHVQARAEHVLVVLRVHARPHQRAVPGVGLALAEQVGGQLASQLDLKADGAVLRRAHNKEGRNTQLVCAGTYQ